MEGARVEPQHSLWRAATHEAGHAVMAYVHHGRVEGIRVHSGLCDAEIILPPDTEPARKAVAHMLVALAGLEAEALLCGRIGSEAGQPDLRQFKADLQQAGIFSTWPYEAARLAFGALTRELLQQHDRFVYALAAEITQKRHVFGEDVHATLALHKKLWGVKASPLMAKDWQGAVLAALAKAADDLEIDALVRRVNRTGESWSHKAHP